MGERRGGAVARPGLHHAGLREQDPPALGAVADQVGQDAERQHDRGRRHPGQLPAVPSLQDVVVDRDQHHDIRQQKETDEGEAGHVHLRHLQAGIRQQGRTTVRTAVAAVAAAHLIDTVDGGEVLRRGGGGE